MHVECTQLPNPQECLEQQLAYDKNVMAWLKLPFYCYDGASSLMRWKQLPRMLQQFTVRQLLSCMPLQLNGRASSLDDEKPGGLAPLRCLCT